ncbi:MAG: extracellular solute-binding protein [Caldilineaceae bacterium]
MTKIAKSMSRRAFLQGVGVVGIGGALAACATVPGGSNTAAGGENAPAAEGKTIQFWVFWGQPGVIAEQILADEALQSALNGNKLDFRTGVNEEARLTAVAGGLPPDIGALSNYQSFMATGVVMPLDDYIATSDVISQDKFIEANWQVCQYEGKMYGIPALECFLRSGFNYNSRMVEEAGLDPATPPTTWDELFAWHETLTKFDDAGNLIQIGIDPYDAIGSSWGTGSIIANSWGFIWYDEGTGEFNLDNEMVATGLDTMGEFVKLIGPDNLTGMRSVEGQGTWGGSYNAEVQAMILEGYWHPGETTNEAPEVAKYNRATWIPVPEERRGTRVQYGGGHMVQIFRDAKYHDEAWPVAEWLQSNSANDLLFNNIGWLPAYIPYYDSVDQGKYPGLQWYFDSVEQSTYWGPVVLCPIQPFIQQKYAQYREAVYRGEMTGAEAAASWQDDAVKELRESGFAKS